MISKNIDYIAPENVTEALDLMSEYAQTASVLAGGTDVIPRLRAGTLKPGYLIDLRKLPIDHLEIEGNRVRLGARLTQADVLASSDILTLFPALGEACQVMAGPSIRNRATLGGNIVNASPAADCVPPLLIYDAEVVLEKVTSQRVVPLDEFFLGPGETVIQAEELLTEIRIPIPHVGTGSKFIKVGVRNAMAIAVASVAIRLSFNGDMKIQKARIALGSVAPTPIRAYSAETLLEGERPTELLFKLAANEAEASASPISDLRANKDYRKRMVNVLVKRCLTYIWKDHRAEANE